MSGKWEKLTEYLINNGGMRIELTDNQLAIIVDSSDRERPFRIDHQTYSIRQRALDAGYDVSMDTHNKEIKIFTKKR